MTLARKRELKRHVESRRNSNHRFGQDWEGSQGRQGTNEKQLKKTKLPETHLLKLLAASGLLGQNPLQQKESKSDRVLENKNVP